MKPQYVIAHTLVDDGVYPNNGTLPLLVYQGALVLPEEDPAAAVEAVFQANGWRASWRNVIYSVHHYHSTAHETLGIFSGSARVQFGGDGGVELAVTAGDVVIIPAGVAHKNLGSSPDFRCVGAYPPGQIPDMNYGQPGERPQVEANIAQVSLPQTDPVYGPGGLLAQHWQAR